MKELSQVAQQPDIATARDKPQVSQELCKSQHLSGFA